MVISCQKETKKTITIACASNMQFTLKQIVNNKKVAKKNDFNIILGSSGKLTAQIEAGAPFDIFLSANAEYPKYLISKNINYPKAKTYAYAKLGVFSNTKKNIDLLSFLTSIEVKKIAIPNPKTAPYGKMAKETLKNMGIYNKIKHKLVYGESVMQSNLFVISGAADIGFTAISTLNNLKTESNFNFQKVPDSLYTSIEQQILILNPRTETNEFKNFILSQKGQSILKEYGYGSIY